MYRCRECKTEYKEKVEYCDCGNNTFDYIEDKNPAKKENTSLTLEQKSELVSRIFFALCIILSIIIWSIPIGNTPAKKQKAAQTKTKTNINKTIPNIDKIWDDTPIYQPRTQGQQSEVNNTQKPIPLTSTPVDYARRITENTQNKSKKINKIIQPTNINKKAKQEITQQPIQIEKQKITPQPQIHKEPQKPAYNPNSPEMLRYKNLLRAALFSKFAVGSIQGSGECSIQFSVDKTGKLINRKFTKESSNKGLNDTVYYMMMSVPRFNPPPDEYNGETIRMNFKINNGNYEITIN